MAVSGQLDLNAIQRAQTPGTRRLAGSVGITTGLDSVEKTTNS